MEALLTLEPVADLVKRRFDIVNDADPVSDPEPLALLQQRVGEALEQMLPEPVVGQGRRQGRSAGRRGELASQARPFADHPNAFEILRPDKVTDHLPQALEQPGVEALKDEERPAPSERLSQPPLARLIDPQFHTLSTPHHGLLRGRRKGPSSFLAESHLGRLQGEPCGELVGGVDATSHQ